MGGGKKMINLQKINLGSLQLTKEQANNLKKALKTGNFLTLRTWKEKFMFQVLSGDVKTIKTIGQLAEKENRKL
jgi:hypothetical protein